VGCLLACTAASEQRVSAFSGVAELVSLSFSNLLSAQSITPSCRPHSELSSRYRCSRHKRGDGEDVVHIKPVRGKRAGACTQ
jgi:hypothetical protein